MDHIKIIKSKSPKVFFWSLIIPLLFLLLPSLSFGAPPPTTPNTVSDIFTGFTIGQIIGYFPVLFIIALVVFLVGVIKFIGAGDYQEKRSSGKQVMIYGIIVLFVMVSMWSLVKLITVTFFGKGPSVPNYLPGLL